MLKSFRSKNLERAWTFGKELPHRTPTAVQIFDALDVINAVDAPRDASFAGFRFDEWTEAGQLRFGVMITQRWLVSYSWDGHNAIDAGLERIA